MNAHAPHAIACRAVLSIWRTMQKEGCSLPARTFQVLTAVAATEHEPATFERLGKLLDMDKDSVSHRLSDLRKRKLVIVAPHPDRDRAKHGAKSIRLSARASELLTKPFNKAA